MIKIFINMFSECKIQYTKILYSNIHGLLFNFVNCTSKNMRYGQKKWVPKGLSHKKKGWEVCVYEREREIERSWFTKVASGCGIRSTSTFIRSVKEGVERWENILQQRWEDISQYIVMNTISATNRLTVMVVSLYL